MLNDFGFSFRLVHRRIRIIQPVEESGRGLCSTPKGLGVWLCLGELEHVRVRQN